MWQKYQKQGLQVLAVSLWPRGDKVEKAKEFVEKHHLTFPILVGAPDSLWKAYGPAGVPRVVILGRDGKVADNLCDPKDAALLKAVQAAVDAGQ